MHQRKIYRIKSIILIIQRNKANLDVREWSRRAIAVVDGGRYSVGWSPSCGILFISALGVGGKSPCFEVDLYERTSSASMLFLLISARCHQTTRHVLCSWLMAWLRWVGSRRTQHPATSALPRGYP